jgi:hypothetical protein
MVKQLESTPASRGMSSPVIRRGAHGPSSIQIGVNGVVR